MINADTIQTLKEQADILKIFEGYGHSVKKTGKGYFVQCPFHEDDTASLSITPKKKLWQCFGCGASGDVISFIQKKEGCSFPEAAKKLAEMENISAESLTVTESTKPLKRKEERPKQGEQSPFTDTEILKKVTGYYHQTFLTKPEGRAYLKSRGITKEDVFTDYKIGYSNGTLLHVIPKEDAVYEQLIRLGILLENRKERFLNCVIFPITNKSGDVVGVYGRHILMKTGGHFYLPGARSGIFNEAYLKTEKPSELIITESIIDAVSFMEQDILNVLPIYGTNGFTETHRAILKELHPTKLVIALDGDETGRHASEQLKEKLEKDFSFNCQVVIFPHNQDANAYFQENTKGDFYRLASGEPSQNQAKLTGHYHIKWAELRGTRLAVTIKAENKETGRFILDTFNLYSQRDRDKLVQKTVEVFKLNQAKVEREIEHWIPEVEKLAKDFKGKSPDPNAEEEPQATMTDDEEQEALNFLKSETLFEDIVKDYEEMGYVGEALNKTLAYLVMTSRKMQNPLSLVIMSNSAAGKSSLQKATMSFCPKEDGKHFTRLTQQSLYYLGESSLKHKFLSIEEEEGSSEANYSIKTLLSSKQLTVAATAQDPQTGRKYAEEYTTEGPLALMMSTTSAEIEAELESRTLVISVDESQDQTNSIHLLQRHARTTEGRKLNARCEALKKKHHNAQRLLKSGLIVTNNYAPQLIFPNNRIRFRRAHEHYLDLIDCVAFLRQYQKETKQQDHLGEYIEVDKEDIRIANTIFTEVMGTTLDELKPATRDVLAKIVEFCKTNDTKAFYRRQLREYGDYSLTHVQRHLKKLEELEYIWPVSGSNGSRFMYELLYEDEGKQDQKFVMGLKPVESLKQATEVHG